MQNIIKTLLVFLWLYYPGQTVWAQSGLIDSLNNLLEKPETNSGVRIQAMEKLITIRAAENQLPLAMRLADSALQLSYRETDPSYAALIHSARSALFVREDSLKQAFLAVDSASWYANKSDDTLVQARVRFRRGWLEHRVEDTDQAYQHMLEALRMLEGKQQPYYESNIYHYLAAIQGYWGNVKEQLHYTRLCVDRARESGDPDALSNAYLSMGTSYLYRYRKADSVANWLDSAKYFYTTALNITRDQSDRITLPTTQGILALNLANIYYEFYPASYQDSAEFYLDMALKTGQAYNHPELIANSYGIRSEYAMRNGKYPEAKALLLSAMQELMDSPGGSQYKSRISEALARVAESSGDLRGALTYYKQHLQFDRQVFNEDKMRISQGLEAQYGAEKKALALQSAQQEAAFTKKLNRYYLMAIIAGILVLFFLFRAYHFKIKAAQQQHLRLSGEKHEAELQANLQAEEAARLKAERSLTKERMERLEKELLAGSLQVEEKNKMLEDLQEKLGSLAEQDPLRRQMSRLITQSQQSDRNYEDLRSELSEVHPGFITGLQQQADNKLTRLDLKYCSYILMGLSNKEIAYRLNVDPKSIRMARYRLKQKLKLDKEQQLDQFILSINDTVREE